LVFLGVYFDFFKHTECGVSGAGESHRFVQMVGSVGLDQAFWRMGLDGSIGNEFMTYN